MAESISQRLSATTAYQQGLEAQRNAFAEQLTSATEAEPQPATGTFLQTVRSLAEGAITDHRAAEELSYQAVRGEAELTDVIPAILNAEQQLNTIVAFRDRILSAYQTIARMPL